MKTTRTATKDLINQIKSIEVKTGEIKQIVDALPDSTVKDAFTYSVINLEKKIEKFTSVRQPLTDEQKKKLAEFRKSLIAESQKEIPKIPANENLKKKKTH